MRYAATHKDETRKALLIAAGRQLRALGPDRVAVAAVMKSAGLTHGGFYAHFKSKDSLLAEALVAIFGASKRRMMRMLEGLPPKHALATYIDFYVAPRHRDDPAHGCPITALSSDMPRQSKKFRATFETGVTSLSAHLAKLMAEAGIAHADKLAPSILAAMAGAVALARTISDATLSDELLASTRAGIKARLGLTETALAEEPVP